MITRAIRLGLLAAFGCLTAAAAQAGTSPTTTFDWNPRAVGLNGAKFTADTMRLSDFGQIVLTIPPTGGVTTFTEAGYLPILGFSLGGQPITASGFNAASGKGWGAFLQYQATGTQSITTDGIVADYSSLNYSIYGFNGLATYGFDTTGAAHESGATNLTLLGDGSLIAGSVTLVPTSFVGTTPVAFDVHGQIQASIEDVPHQLSSYTFLGLDVNIVHPPGELSPTSPTSFEADGGSSSTATVITGRGHSVHMDRVALSVSVPEPGSGWLFAAGLVPLSLLRRPRRVSEQQALS